MKPIKIFILLAALMLLCSCTRSGIGDKLIVKAIFLEKSPQFTVQLMVIKATPSADAGSADENIDFLVGKGETLFDAFQQAEQSYSGDVFYGQNELLLIGPELQQGPLFESCRYLSGNSTGRPNMAVYGIDLTAEQVGELDECGKDFLNHMDQISQQDQYQTFLYQMIHSNETAILPILHCDLQGNVQLTQLDVYCHGRKSEEWNNSQQVLACLLSGQEGNSQTLQLYDNGNPVTLDLRTPKLFYECEQKDGELTLKILLTGHVQTILGAEGVYPQSQKAEVIGRLNQEVETLAQSMIEQTFTPEMDLFSICSRFNNQNQSITNQMKQSQILYQPQRIQFVSSLTIV